MKFFLNSIDLAQIERFYDMQLIAGVTTNPTLLARSQQPSIVLIGEISRISPGPVSVQVTSEHPETMLEEARRLAGAAENIVIKVPANNVGFAVASKLEAEGISVNVTLCFTLGQALWAANMGVSYLSVFSGRLSEQRADGEGTLREIVTVLKRETNSSLQIIGAALGRPEHVLSAARAGADIATTSPDVLEALLESDLTQTGLAMFLSDWTASGHHF